MHPHFEFPMRQVLWTLTFAAHLVLLVVLLGRDRVRRYPWFTAAITLSALQLMAEELLAGRMANIPYGVITLTLANVTTIIGLLVLVEMARSAFAGVPRSIWIVNTAGLLLVSGVILPYMGPWPIWKELPWGTMLVNLYLMQLAAQKGELLLAMLTVGLGALVVIFGRHYKAGWRSHTQQIVIGLMAVAVSLLALEVAVLRTFHFTQAEAAGVMRLRMSFAFAHEFVFLAALVWWIVWLWRDEPGTDTPPPTAE